MSGEALKWALDQRAGDVGTQMIIHLLALRADEVGAMTPINIPYLVERSRQSERTVSRCLGDLEKAGVVEREVRHSEDGGRVLVFRLRLDRRLQEFSASERNAMQKAHGEKDVDDDNSGPADSAGPDQVPPNTVPGPADLASGPAKSAGPSLYSESNKLSQSAGAPARERAASPDSDGEDENDPSEEAFEKRWARFNRTFPWTPSMPRATAKQALRNRLVKDQIKAVRAAPVYAENCKRDKRRYPPMTAEQWIKSGEFDHVLDQAQGQAEAQGLKRPPVWVIKGTDAWSAHRTRYFEDHLEKLRGRKASEMTDDDLPEFRRAKWSEEHKSFGAFFPTLFPPKREASSTGPPSSKPKPPDEDIHVDF